ncbi:uncharacterized protein LOC123557314 [Mercenaria mercenaria]|uniref:uncharacterized protein LOC123557314 n=1 Tax=Mercenaria mercenaria TaxID=6596 RepID=UPI00234EDEAB|nr:uncharacterized protein LOC123557314 [Mercenaria mercenaria]
MGNYVSKCCGRDGRKYKKKKETVKAIQPEQDDPNAKVATNTGTTKDVPSASDTAVTPDTKEVDRAATDKKDKEKKDEKKPHRKHKRKKYSESSDDSSDFWTSSSSESSDSDSDAGHTKSSRKVYKNKGGGTTIISKKTVIGGHKMSIGKNAKNLTINIGSNKSSPTVNQSSPPKEKEKGKPFESYYSEATAREEEQRQFTSLWEHNTALPGGNFIDTRDIHVKEYVFESSVRVDASRWVCMICFPGGSGTGFRVGTKYIMTANHVVKHILDAGYQQIGQTQNAFSRLQDSSVYAVFNYMTEGQITERHKFRFRAIVHFFDDATDTAILELEDNSVGTSMPLSFTFFSFPRLNNRFTFIGHSEGNRMEFNHVDRIIDMNSTETQRDIVKVKQMSLQHSRKDYEAAPYNTLTNPDRYLFHCKFTKGASGSPGVVILEDGRVVVVTMLLCGLPDWYYDMSVQDNIKNNWPKEYCVEQGVNLKSVYDLMSTKNPTLCRDIFSDHTDSIPNPKI